MKSGSLFRKIGMVVIIVGAVSSVDMLGEKLTSWQRTLCAAITAAVLVMIFDKMVNKYKPD